MPKEALKLCFHIRGSNIAPGWGCCHCRMYNGYQRTACRGCGHKPCYDTTGERGHEALELQAIGHDPNKMRAWLEAHERQAVN
jgi:hypothetical protein